MDANVQEIEPKENLDLSTENMLLKNENEELKNQLKESVAECEKLKHENKKYLSDLKSLNKLYSQACKTYVGKDLKIRLLEKKCMPDGLLFESYKEQFGDEILKDLRRLNGNKRNDSTLVLKCIRKLYEHEIDQLKNIRACGRTDASSIPPNKRMVVENIFLERLSNANLTDNESTERFARLNGLINDAINNVLRPKVSFLMQNVPLIRLRTTSKLCFQVKRANVAPAKSVALDKENTTDVFDKVFLTN